MIFCPYLKGIFENRKSLHIDNSTYLTIWVRKVDIRVINNCWPHIRLAHELTTQPRTRGHASRLFPHEDTKSFSNIDTKWGDRLFSSLLTSLRWNRSWTGSSRSTNRWSLILADITWVPGIRWYVSRLWLSLRSEDDVNSIGVRYTMKMTRCVSTPKDK